METFTSALRRTIRNNKIQTQNEENENKLINFEISNEDYCEVFVVLRTAVRHVLTIRKFQNNFSVPLPINQQNKVHISIYILKLFVFNKLYVCRLFYVFISKSSNNK